MRIGLLTDNYPHTGGFGGIGSYTRAVAEELARLGHRVHVFTNCDTPSHRVERRTIRGVEVWQCPAWSRRRRMPLRNALEYTAKFGRDGRGVYRYAVFNAVRTAARREGRFDVIETPEYGGLGELVREAGFADRFSVRLHGPPAGPDRPYEAALEKRGALGCDTLTSPTLYSLRACEARWGVTLQAAVIGNPVDSIESDEPPATPADDPRRAGGVYFGRLEERKGLDVLGRALGPIRRSHPEFRMTLTGKNVIWADGRMGADALAEAAAEGGAGDSAYELFCDPPLDNAALKARVRRARVCVLPSRLETFGIVVVEAMTWGTPVVVSDIPPFRELGVDGEHFLLFKSGDAGDLAAKVGRLLDDPELACRLASNAVPHARRWSVREVVPALLDAWLHGPPPVAAALPQAVA